MLREYFGMPKSALDLRLDPCRLVLQVKEIPSLETHLRALRPLPPCVAGESDSAAFEKHDDFAAQCKSSATESDSPAGRAGRGLVNCGGCESSQRIFFTCHARWQGSSQIASYARSSRRNGYLINSPIGPH